MLIVHNNNNARYYSIININKNIGINDAVDIIHNQKCFGIVCRRLEII